MSGWQSEQVSGWVDGGRNNWLIGGSAKEWVYKESCCGFLECGETGNARVRVRVRARLANWRRVEKCACVVCLSYSMCGSTKLVAHITLFGPCLSMWVLWSSLYVNVWLLVKCMPCILITPQHCEKLSSSSSSSSNSSNTSKQCVENWTVREWTSKQKHLPKDSVVKKIQREKKQHRHDITIGPEVAQRRNTLSTLHL